MRALALWLHDGSLPPSRAGAKVTWHPANGPAQLLRGLRFLKDRLGSRLQESIVLYTGEYAYQVDGWIQVVPLCRLWT
jgi:hypothetical protein